MQATQTVDAGRLRRLIEAVEHDVESGLYDGAQIALGRGGELLLDEAVGYADRGASRKLKKDDVLVPFSISKQLVVAVVLSYVERGLLNLYQPVAEVLPDFGARGKHSDCLWPLNTHTGGVLADVPMLPPEDIVDLEKFTAFVCAQAPEATAGERVVYSKLAPPGDRYVAPVIARYRRPAGMFTPEVIELSAQLVLMPGSVLPGAGYTTTARDFYKFADLLRGGGVCGGFRLLSPAMIELASRNYTGDMPNSLLDFAVGLRNWPPWPAYHGLGFFVRGERLTPGPLPNLGRTGTFGGWGAGTSVFWVEPNRDVCFILITVGSLEDSDHLQRSQRLGDMALAAVTD
ncbi:MAG: serine hydrolase [Gammaproteobacteria bacterium]